MTTDELLTRYDVDLAHARHVADLALAVFDATRSLHAVPKGQRGLLEVGALLHNVGMTTDPPQHHIVGRDIVLGAQLDGFDEDERAVVACLVSFHRKKVRPNLEPAYLRLSKRHQQVALRLAAILRVADGLDYSESQATRIADCQIDTTGVCLQLSGPHAASDGARAVEKSDLWQKAFGVPVRVSIDETIPQALPEPDEASFEPQAETRYQPTPQVTLAEITRQALRRHFRHLLAQERAVRADDDIEAVHQFRVATRRLRATLAVAAEVAPVDQIRAFRRAIQRVARVAGVVRDCDVFLAQIAGYSAEHATYNGHGNPAAGLDPLQSALQRDRSAAHARLIERLDGSRYAEFKREFAAFMTDDATGWNTRLRVRDLAGSMLWRRYEELRAHEVDFDPVDLTQTDSEALHAARISGKRLRYLIEIFGETTTQPVKPLLEPLVALQDRFGELQDAAVAINYVNKLNLSADQRAGLVDYLARRTADHEYALQAVPAHWEKVMSATYRRRLMEFIVKL